VLVLGVQVTDVFCFKFLHIVTETEIADNENLSLLFDKEAHCGTSKVKTPQQGFVRKILK
jgi:hypothetical protein